MCVLNHFKSIFLVSLLTFSMFVTAQDAVPVISYTFEGQKAADDNNTYQGSLYGNASIVQMTDGNYALHTGAGYMDLTAAMGQTITAGLSGSYSISVDLCIGSANSLSGFAWLYAFANGTSQYMGLINTAGNGNWYYEIKNSSTLSTKSNNGLTTNVWHNITVVQNGSVNMLYIDGVLKVRAL